MYNNIFLVKYLILAKNSH